MYLNPLLQTYHLFMWCAADTSSQGCSKYTQIQQRSRVYHRFLLRLWRFSWYSMKFFLQDGVSGVKISVCVFILFLIRCYLSLLYNVLWLWWFKLHSSSLKTLSSKRKNAGNWDTATKSKRQYLDTGGEESYHNPLWLIKQLRFYHNSCALNDRKKNNLPL